MRGTLGRTLTGMSKQKQPELRKLHPLFLWRTERNIRGRAFAAEMGVTSSALSKIEHYSYTPTLPGTAWLVDRTGLPYEAFLPPDWDPKWGFTMVPPPVTK